MALNGSNSTTFSKSSYFRLRLVWSASQNIGGNSSSVTAILYLDSLSAYGPISDGTSSATSITINGNKKSFNATSAVGANQSKELGRHTVTVGHNSDGTKTFSLSASHHVDITWSGQFLGTINVSGSHTLNTIPRTSSFTLDKSSVNYGQAVRITIKPAASGFTHTVRYDWNSNKGTIWSKINWNQGDWTVPMSFINYITTATSTWGTIYVDTYSGNTLIGTSSQRLTTNVPGGVDPTVGSLVAVEANTGVSSVVSLGTNTFVQSLSNIKLTMGSVGTAYGAAIKEYKIGFNSVTKTGSTTQTFTNTNLTGTMTATATVTDTRGRSASKVITLTMVPYAPPSISSATASRSDNGLGDKVTVVRKGTISSLNGKNKYTVYVDYKPRVSSTWTNDGTVTVAGVLGATTINTTNTLGPTFDVTSSYDLRVNLHDIFGKATAAVTISTAGAVLSLGKNSVGVGKIPEGLGAFEVRGGIYTDELISQIIPPGTDLNNYNKTGFYHQGTSANVNSIANTPSNLAFSLLVEKHAGISQTFTDYSDNKPRKWFRNMYNGVWGKWEILFDTSGWIKLSLRNVGDGNLNLKFLNGVVNLTGWINRAGEQRAGVAIANLPSWACPNIDTRFLGTSYELHTSYPEQHGCTFLLKSTDGELSIQRKTGVERWYIDITFMTS